MAEFFNPEGTNQTPAKVTPINERQSIRQNPFYQAIVTDIMIPTAMNTIYDIGHSLLNRICYGSFSSRRGGYRAGRGETWTSYDAYYKEDKRRTEGTVVAVGAKNECFRVYKTVRESYEDHSNFLKRERYARLYTYDMYDYKAWAKGLKACGYATSPSYADRLIKIIETYELYRYDRGDYSRKCNENIG